MLSIIESARFLSQPDQPFGGKAVWKYLLRGTVFYRWSRMWASYLLRDEESRQMLSLHPRLLFKPQRPYMRKDAGPARRVRWLLQHYRWVREHWPWPFMQALLRTKRVALATLAGASGTPYHVALHPTCKFDREGELLLTLEHEGHALATVSFAMHRSDCAWELDIGCLQGPRPEHGREAVKQATSDLHGLRPKQAVMLGLYALARGYGIEQISAVSNRDHVHMARWRSRDHIAADYDSYWMELGGVLDGDGFALPMRLARKDAASIPSRKRAQYRRRHELEDTLIAQVSGALPGCKTRSVFEPRPIAVVTVLDTTQAAANSTGAYDGLAAAA